MFLQQIKFNFAPISRSPLGLLFLSLFFVFAPKIVLAQVIINEIMYDLAKEDCVADGTDTDREWVELYNNSTESVTLIGGLKGWRFNDGSPHLLSESPTQGSMAIPPNEYAIIVADAPAFIQDHPNFQGTIIDTSMGLNNTADALFFADPDGNKNEISYQNSLGAKHNCKTLEWDGAALKESLVDGGTPGRVNSVLTSGDASPSAAPSASPASASTPTPSLTPAAPSYQYSQNVFINEFLPWPEDGDKEWVELINTDNAAINLSGWQIDDADNSTSPQAIPANTTIDANGFLVISFNKNTLNNDGDKVRLLWPDDQIVHSVTYDKSKQGQAVAKFDSGWLWTNQPTPGQVNKKSFVERNEFISSTNASNNTDKITAVEEAVTVQTVAPRVITANNQNITTPTSAPPENNFTPDRDAPSPDLVAAAGAPIKNSSSLNTILTLFGVVAFAALAAGGLIYFRRQKQVDNANFDD